MGALPRADLEAAEELRLAIDYSLSPARIVYDAALHAELLRGPSPRIRLGVLLEAMPRVVKALGRHQGLAPAEGKAPQGDATVAAVPCLNARGLSLLAAALVCSRHAVITAGYAAKVRELVDRGNKTGGAAAMSGKEVDEVLNQGYARLRKGLPFQRRWVLSLGAVKRLRQLCRATAARSMDGAGGETGEGETDEGSAEDASDESSKGTGLIEMPTAGRRGKGGALARAQQQNGRGGTGGSSDSEDEDDEGGSDDDDDLELGHGGGGREHHAALLGLSVARGLRFALTRQQSGVGHSDSDSDSDSEQGPMGGHASSGAGAGGDQEGGAGAGDSIMAELRASREAHVSLAPFADEDAAEETKPDSADEGVGASGGAGASTAGTSDMGSGEGEVPSLAPLSMARGESVAKDDSAFRVFALAAHRHVNRGDAGAGAGSADPSGVPPLSRQQTLDQVDANGR